MAEEYYSTVKDVIQSTGIRPTDLGMESDTEGEAGAQTAAEKLETWIETRLVEIKDLIDHDRNRDYAAEAEADGKEIPPGIHGIALRMMANHVGYAVLRRTTPIIRVDDFAINAPEEHLFTASIKSSLRRYPAKLDGLRRRFGFIVATGASSEED